MEIIIFVLNRHVKIKWNFLNNFSTP